MLQTVPSLLIEKQEGEINIRNGYETLRDRSRGSLFVALRGSPYSVQGCVKPAPAIRV
ncbi:MAG: hypothetical protein FGF51_07810 [Candidatus Brockarchaeota archaeon]|nr:hypothetical protein [Candidatus Brockarchaeota archaeon]